MNIIVKKKEQIFWDSTILSEGNKKNSILFFFLSSLRISLLPNNKFISV